MIYQKYNKNLETLTSEEIKKEIKNFRNFLKKQFNSDFISELLFDENGITISYSRKNLFGYSKETKILFFKKYKSAYSSVLEFNKIDFNEKMIKKFQDLEKIFISNFIEENKERDINNVDKTFIKKINGQNNLLNNVSYYKNKISTNSLLLKYSLQEDFVLKFEEITIKSSYGIEKTPLDKMLKIFMEERVILEKIRDKYHNKSVWDFITKEDVYRYTRDN